jgi:O-antigen ligase
MALIVGVVAAQAIGLRQAVTQRPMGEWRQVRVTEERAGETVQLQAVRVGGLARAPNFYAYSSVAVLPMCLAGVVGGRRKWAWAAAAAVLAVALVLSSSRGALIACAAGLAWFAFRARGARLAALVVVGAAVVVAATLAPAAYLRRMTRVREQAADLSVQRRVEAWQACAAAIEEHPLFGIGPGNARLINPHGLYPHNSYLHIATEIGVPGLMLFLAVVGLSLRDAFRIRGPTRGPTATMGTGLEGAMVATCVFWLFFSMWINKLPWFLLGLAAAWAHAPRAER